MIANSPIFLKWRFIDNINIENNSIGVNINNLPLFAISIALSILFPILSFFNEFRKYSSKHHRSMMWSQKDKQVWLWK